MNAAPLPLIYFPLVWIGCIGTSLTYAALARSHIDLSRVLASLNIRNPFTFAVSVYNMWTIGAALILSFLFRWRGITIAEIGLEGSLSLIGAIRAISGAVLAVALWPILMRVTGFFSARLFRMQLLDHQHSTKLSVIELVLLTTFGVIIGPAVEELIFRGYLLTMLQQHTMSAAGATLGASLIFASIHFAFGVGVVVFAFFSSLLLSLLFLVSNSLYPAILMHSLINLWGFVAWPILSHVGSPDST